MKSLLLHKCIREEDIISNHVLHAVEFNNNSSTRCTHESAREKKANFQLFLIITFFAVAEIWLVHSGRFSYDFWWSCSRANDCYHRIEIFLLFAQASETTANNTSKAQSSSTKTKSSKIAPKVAAGWDHIKLRLNDRSSSSELPWYVWWNLEKRASNSLIIKKSSHRSAHALCVSILYDLYDLKNIIFVLFSLGIWP